MDKLIQGNSDSVDAKTRCLREVQQYFERFSDGTVWSEELMKDRQNEAQEQVSQSNPSGVVSLANPD